MYADMVGYSRLIGLDDAGTLERLRALRRNLIDPAIEEHGGRIVQTGGDSLLVVFDSIDGAVRCAVQVQQQMPIHDGDRPPDRAIRFRVGINIGDAIANGTDLHGDAVNVASRLQAECPPGGICVSRSVRDHIHGRLDLAFDALGALDLKNISRPVEAFVLRTADTPTPVEQTLVQGTSDPLPLPGKPSIAVLAFTNMSGDPEQEYFSDGIADDIITELSRSHSLFVIARNSSFTYRGLSIDIKQVARELGVRYVLEGSVRRSGAQVRVGARLVDAETGNHIWAERYDRALQDVFGVQDEITAAVVAAIHPAVADAEQRRALRRPPESLGAWQAYQRGLWHMSKFSGADSERATRFLEQAISLDPTFAAAYSNLALAYTEAGAVHALRPLDESIGLAKAAALKAVEYAPNDAEAHAALAFATLLEGNRAGVSQRLAFALECNENSTWANGIQGLLLAWSGRGSEAREYLRTALRLNPRDPRNALFMHQIETSYYFEHDYGNAVEASRRAIAAYPGYPQPYRWLAAALGQQGRTSEAREALHEAVSISPQGFDRYVRKRPPWFRPEEHEHLLDGLRKAGWEG
jgi:adenylate cyclase